MGKAKWWVCEDCTSLNDLPANKCYKCRVSKPRDPKLFDDQYSHVGGGDQRVGITVDLANVGDLTRPDPVESAEGGSIMEAFDKTDDPYADIDQADPTPRYDPYSGGPETPSQQAEPRPLREPTKRGIDALGGRGWAEGLEPREGE